MKNNGDCYPNAYKQLMKLFDEDIEKAVVVHGRFTNKDGTVIDHAWVEVGDIVIDASQDAVNPIHATKESYYRVGKVGSVKTYSYDEALQNLIFKGHYGPWDD